MYAPRTIFASFAPIF